MDVEIIIQDSGDVTLEENDDNSNNNKTNDTTTNDDNNKQKGKEKDDSGNNDDAANNIPKMSIDTGTLTTENNQQPNWKRSKEEIQEQRIKELATKLDFVMLLLFKETEKFAKQDPVNNILILYEIISSIFESVVLVTHKSKFVQFLILHLCGVQIHTMQQHQQLQQHDSNSKFDNTVSIMTPTSSTVDIDKMKDDCTSDCNDRNNNINEYDDDQQGMGNQIILYREFAAKLIDIVLDPSRATVIRQTSACYLASFVCRAQYVSIQTICEAVEALVRWAEAYIESIDEFQNDIYHPMHSITDTKERCSMYALFYTVVQSALYIMCFSGYEINQYYEVISNTTQGDNNDDDENQLSYVKVGSDRWSNICCHWLQPLRYCLESVRTEFLQISKQFNLLDKETYDKLIEDEERRAVGLQQLSLVRKHLQRRNSWYTRKVRRSYEQNASNNINTPERGTRKVIKRSNSAMSISTLAATSISVGTTTTSAVRLVSSSASYTGGASVSTIGLENERQEGGVGGLGQGTNPLDSFFPFDPYLLRLSHDYVDPYYRHWQTHSTDADDYEDDDDDDNNNEETMIMVGTEVHAFDREDASTIADNSVMHSDVESEGEDDDNDEDDGESNMIDAEGDDDDEDDLKGQHTGRGTNHNNPDEEGNIESDDDDDGESIEHSIAAHSGDGAVTSLQRCRRRFDRAMPAKKSSSNDCIIEFENSIQHDNLIRYMKRPRAPSLETGSW